MTGYELALSAVDARLKAQPSPWSREYKRSHLTDVPKDRTPACHLVDGEDKPTNRCQRDASFKVSLFVRSDAPAAIVDDLKVEVMRRLNPETAAYPPGVSIKPGRIATDTEIADLDATRVDMDFSLCYDAAEWSLGGA